MYTAQAYFNGGTLNSNGFPANSLRPLGAVSFVVNETLFSITDIEYTGSELGTTYADLFCQLIVDEALAIMPVGTTGGFTRNPATGFPATIPAQYDFTFSFESNVEISNLSIDITFGNWNLSFFTCEPWVTGNIITVSIDYREVRNGPLLSTGDIIVPYDGDLDSTASALGTAIQLAIGGYSLSYSFPTIRYGATNWDFGPTPPWAEMVSFNYQVTGGVSQPGLVGNVFGIPTNPTYTYTSPPEVCNFDFTLKSRYFFSPSEDSLHTSLTSDLPDGEVWRAKSEETTNIFSLVRAVATMFGVLRLLIEKLSKEFSIYTTVDLIEVHEKSVGLPDPRLGEDIPQDLCSRRQRVLDRITKQNTVTFEEAQTKLDETFPDYGIWLSTGQAPQAFRYTFRYTFLHGGSNRDRFIIFVNIPWFVIDPGDPSNDKLTWENLRSWLKDFFPGYVSFVPVYIEQASYCVITSPQMGEEVYTQGDGQGNWTEIPVYWKQIDINGTVINVVDSEEITPNTTSITRSFTDSTSTLIETTNSISLQVIP